MRVFLTGANGYIGSAVAEFLAERGHTVLGLAHSDASAESLAAVGYRVHRGDLRDAASLASGARAAEAVIHLGFSMSADGGDVDTTATRALLSAVEGTAKPLVYTSGAWVIGRTSRPGVAEPADEETPLAPIPLVAWRVPLEAELREAAEYGVRTVIIRPALAYGKGGGIPAMLAASAEESGVVRYVGDGENRWSAVHVNDLAALYVRAVEAASVGTLPAGSILLGVDGREPVRLREVAAAASRGAGLSGEVTSWPLDEARSALGPFADALALDQRLSNERAQRLLGWEPSAEYGLAEDLEKGSYSEATATAA